MINFFTIPALSGTVTRNMVLLALALAAVTCIIQFIRTPPIAAMRFNRACKRNGIKNCSDEYPRLRSVRSDHARQHGMIWEVCNMGVTVSQFEEKAEQLQTACNIKIARILLCDNSSRTRFYVTPRKHVKPIVITPNNEALSNKLCDLPNLLCVGKTGSGKSYALSVLLGIYARYVPAVSITICDYKKSSFAQFEDTPNFYGYEEVPDGIRAFYKEFSERLAANDEERNQTVRVLLIDEYGALIGAQDKKAAEELKAMVANMLFMGRSLNMRVVIGVQRADSEHFKAGARDQFKAILALADLSKEQKQMLFADYKDKMTEHCGQGEGYLLIDGQDIERVKVAEVKDFQTLNDTIREAMKR